MTARDIEPAEAELTNIISEKDDSKRDRNAGGVRGDLPIPEGLQQKKVADSVTRKRKTKQHNSVEENDEEEVHKRVKIGDGAIIPKRKGIQSLDTFETTLGKHEHCKVAKCKNCDEAYSLCFKDEACQYHPCEY